MESQVRRLPQTSSFEAKRSLILQKIQHYRGRASELMADESSTMPKSVFLENTENDENQPSAQPMSSPRSTGSVREVDILSGQADAALSQALDFDESKHVAEAITKYMEATDLYLSALKLIEEHKSSSTRLDSVASFLKRRIESTMDRIQDLKGPSITTKQITESCNTTCYSSSSSPIPTTSSTVSLSKEEISVLIRSSTFSSKIFLPWSDKDASQLSSKAQRGGETLFRDPDGYPTLNKKQQCHFWRWARPVDIVHFREKLGIVKSQTPEMVQSITAYTIKQHYVTDCSFIASLCICAAFERRFKKRLVTSIIYPHSKSGAPMLSPEGKYLVKLWLNGVPRCVAVDDYLPIDQSGNLLCSHTSSPSSPYLELWVCIIEKAYMKLCGGYDFPGSNSGIDLFSLTGWIPERIHFARDESKVQDHETPQARVWERIASASCYGDCLITISSEVDLPKQDADSLGLVMGHAYAVLNVIETRKGSRLLLLKNPWAHMSWKGRYSCFDKDTWQDTELRRELSYNPELAQRRDDGVFWIDWETVLHYFSNFHLSWNPALFRYRSTIHGFWPLSQGPLDDAFNVGENPQYLVTLCNEAVEKQAVLWVQISRHVSKQEQEGTEAQAYLTVHIHRTSVDKERIWYPGRSGGCVLRGAYTNNPHGIVRYDIVDSSDKNLALVLSQYSRSTDVAYTLSCYCTERFSFTKPQPNLSHRHALSASLCPTGGPVGSTNFSRNTMIALKVPDPGVTIQFRLSVKKTVALNILLFKTDSYGDDLQQSRGKPVVDSGNYRPGFVVTKRQYISKGSYVGVISCFDQTDSSAPFRLEIYSSEKIEAKVLIGRYV
jgi:calpain-7